MAHIFTILLALCILQSAAALGSADIIFLGNNIVTVDADNPAERERRALWKSHRLSRQIRILLGLA